jgi:hypothetical protein
LSFRSAYTRTLRHARLARVPPAVQVQVLEHPPGDRRPGGGRGRGRRRGRPVHHDRGRLVDRQRRRRGPAAARPAATRGTGRDTIGGIGGAGGDVVTGGRGTAGRGRTTGGGGGTTGGDGGTTGGDTTGGGGNTTGGGGETTGGASVGGGGGTAAAARRRAASAAPRRHDRRR